MGEDLGLLIIRLVIGFFLLSHGLQKVSFLLGGVGLEGASKEFTHDGLLGGKLTAFAAGASQIAAGLLIILGALTPLAAMTAIGVMVVALSVKISNGLWVQNDDIEYPVTIIIVSAALSITGPGNYSIDAVIGLDALPLWISLSAVSLGVIGGAITRKILYSPELHKKQVS